jgi:tetratricopeptide (TPR) repeat protein
LAKRKPPRRQQENTSSELGVRRSSDGRGWVLVHPRSVREMAEDLEEVRAMIEAGELDVATDELRWLVSNCSEFIEAHELLGELALAQGDAALARGHFGFAVQLGLKTLERAKVQGPLSYRQPANESFFLASRGLVLALAKLNQLPKAQELVETLVKLDPTDPLGLRALLEEVRTGGRPMVELSFEFPKDGGANSAP